PFDVLPWKSLFPPYTALICGAPAGNDEVVNTAVPPLNGAVPNTSEDFLNVTVSPSGGAGVTTAVNVTIWPSFDGFGVDMSTVAVTRDAGFSSNPTPQPFALGQ